jgi:hypothetical protein
MEENKALLTIEDYRKKHAVDPSILAAIMQMQHWAAGKKVPETVFTDAVNAFLGAPIGGTSVT